MTKNSQPDYLGAYFQNPDMDGVWYGVKGMKWGVRKDTQPWRKDTQPWGAGDYNWATQLENPATVRKINAAAEKTFKREMKAIVKDYRKRDPNEEDLALRAQFTKDVERALIDSIQYQLDNHLGLSPSGSLRAMVSRDEWGRLTTYAELTALEPDSLLHSEKVLLRFSLTFDLDEEGYPIIDDLEHSSLMTMEEVDEAMDAVQYGVKGMKWGVRRSSRELRKAASARKPTAKKDEPKPEVNKTPSGSSGGKLAENSIQNHVETSTQRYARLEAQAKGGGAKDFTEQDLKFFNARTEALGKVAKMYEKKPGLLASLAQETLKNTTKSVMQEVTGSLAKKYISKPLVDSLAGSKKPAESFLDRVNRTAGEKHAEEQFKSAVDKALSELRKNK